MLVELRNRYRMFVEELGSGFPLLALHGGPGFDLSMFRPYLDPLGIRSVFQVVVATTS